MSNITLGIIGSGQLGSMLCQAAKKLKIKTVVISDDEQGPAQNYANQFIFAKYDDQQKIKEFIDNVDVVTFEFENIPIDILKQIELQGLDSITPFNNGKLALPRYQDVLAVLNRLR